MNNNFDVKVCLKLQDVSWLPNVIKVIQKTQTECNATCTQIEVEIQSDEATAQPSIAELGELVMKGLREGHTRPVL